MLFSATGIFTLVCFQCQYILPFYVQLSLGSRSNGHRLDLDLWLSLGSRSNSHGLDLGL